MAAPRIKPEMWLPISAFLISLCALVVSMVEVRFMRAQQRATVWPYLEIVSSNVNGYTISVTNKGVGPASIRSVVVTTDDRPVTTWRDLLATLVEGDLPPVVNSGFNGRVVASGERIDVIQIKERDVQDRFKSDGPTLDIMVCFCSVYEDCWTVGGGPYEIVEACDTDPDRMFQQ